MPLYTEWENVGGQIMPSEKIQLLFESIKSGSINDWKAVHQYYNLCECEYGQYKVRYALYLLEQLYSSSIEDFTPEIYKNILEDVTVVANEIYNEMSQGDEKTKRKKFFRKYECKVNGIDKDNVQSINQNIDMCAKRKEDEVSEIR